MEVLEKSVEVLKKVTSEQVDLLRKEGIGNIKMMLDQWMQK